MAIGENGNGSSARWQWTFGIVAVAAVVIGALITFFVSTSTVTVQMGNLTGRMETVERYQTTLTERDAELRAATAVTAAKMVEIETQFCASDIVRNLMHANDLRNVAMLWHKIFPEMDYPINNSFYPQICNRAITTK